MSDRPIDCGFQYIGMSNVQAELIRFKTMMDELEVEFFLTAGVLLGIYRDGAPIEYDKDFDVGVMGDADLRRIFASPKIRKYYDEVHYGNNAMVVPNGKLLWLKKYLGNYVIPIEIQAHYVKDDFVYYNRDMGVSWRFRDGRLVWEKRLFQDFKQLTYGGYSFNAPNPPEDFFLTHYGCDWRKPKTYKDWRYHCRNIYQGFWK